MPTHDVIIYTKGTYNFIPVDLSGTAWKCLLSRVHSTRLHSLSRLAQQFASIHRQQLELIQPLMVLTALKKLPSFVFLIWWTIFESAIAYWKYLGRLLLRLSHFCWYDACCCRPRPSSFQYLREIWYCSCWCEISKAQYYRRKLETEKKTK